MSLPRDLCPNDRLDAGRGRSLGEFHRAVQIVFIRERDGGKFVAFGQFDNGFDRKRRIEKGKITVNVQRDESRRGAE